VGFLALSEHEIEAHQTTRNKNKKIQHNNENERLNRKFRREEFLSDTIPFRVIGQFDLFQFSWGPAKKIQFHFFLISRSISSLFPYPLSMCLVVIPCAIIIRRASQPAVLLVGLLLLDGCCNLQQKKPFATFGARFDYFYERVCLI
jgi:hypothetical protein